MDDDPILSEVATRVIPLILVFGLYIVVNGHLSPGGGFAGGSVLGVAMILFALVFGVRRVAGLVGDELLVLLTSLGPVWYAATGMVGLVRGHQFLANSRAGIPLGVPGEVLSSGLVPVITFGVGVSVAVTVVVLFISIVEAE
jgi:multicomponent Na+:H+ antiporter subunit B